MRTRGFMFLLLTAAVLTVDRVEAQTRGLSLKKSMPCKTGLGRMVILTNLPRRGPAWKAVKRLARHRDAVIQPFKEDNVRSTRRKLGRIGPEFVAVAVSPTTVDMNFHLDLLEICRNLDADPMPDFHFGYLAARDGKDFSAFVDRILAREAKTDAGTVARITPLTPPSDKFRNLDYLMHFGHGNPWRVMSGLTGEQVGALSLSRNPVVFSGACFTGVLSRSYHKCARQLIYFKPTTISPGKLLSLNWVHAGVSGYLAAMEGDRGEMAMAEWDHFRERACSLGEVIGYQYRLAFTSLPEDFNGFPRYIPGKKKLMSFYNVMLRGMISRILLSDPAFRPLGKPLDPPATTVKTTFDPEGKSIKITCRIERASQGLFLDCMHMNARGKFSHRLTCRAARPEEGEGRLGKPTVSVRIGNEEIPLSRHLVRHEVWGGVRYVNLQVESADNRLGRRGCTATFTFPVLR